MNAYVGAGFAAERTLGRGAGTQGTGAGMLALGIEHGKRIGAADDAKTASWIAPRSLSVFFQVIDIGAIAAARVRNSSAEVPSPSIAQVISPGIFGVMSVGRSPISFGFGMALAPQARKVTEEGTLEERTRSALRFGIFLAGDVPIFP